MDLETKKPIRAIGVYFHKKKHNFGDLLSLLILNHLGKSHGLRFYYEKDMKKARMAGVGSIAQQLTTAFTGYLWTTGSLPIRSRTVPPPRLRAKSRPMALRGPLTARQYGLQRQGVVFGDGGLLVSRLLIDADQKEPCRTEKNFVLGVIPHYVDLPLIRRYWSQWFDRTDYRILLIDVTSPDPKDVLRAIRRCEAVVSSSLHGLVAADALGVPNRQMIIPSSKKILGGAHKFQDYYQGLGLPRAPRPLRLNADSGPLAHLAWITRYYTWRRQVHETQGRIAAVTTKLLTVLAQG